MVLLLLSSVALAAPEFGADLSAGIAAGALLGDWPVPGVHGAWTVRYDAFLDDRSSGGPRLGLSVIGTGSAFPKQRRRELDDEGQSDEAPFTFLEYGVLAILQTEPEDPWGATFGLGLTRLDLSDYYGGRHAVPVFNLEAALRQRLGETWLYVDYGLRTGWGSAGGPDGDWEDWWTLRAQISLGFHLR
ncbi:MAG: hypothetical protein H6739_05430 [Alphaproteobacteria bacterium]|nr:hypothetical protein [Alphaproteobacteria bacterium]